MTTRIIPQQMSVALLSGGSSGERKISLASGKGAQKALEEAGFKVTVLDPSIKNDLKKLMDENFDVAFLCLHGRKGEDGAIQGFLELLDIPYTGSGICASAIAMNKSKAKVYYRHAEIPTPLSVTLQKGEFYDAEKLVVKLGQKCVVKAATEGSSLGVFIVEGIQAIDEAIQEAFTYDDTVIVETYVKGKEYTVVVLGNDKPAALPIIEIVPINESYDFDSKYLPGGSQHICPAPLSEEMTQKVQALAIQAHCCLGCEGVSRTDFIVDENENCWVLETNTIPGMTETSLLPDAGRAAHIPFSELCTILVESALQKK